MKKNLSGTRKKRSGTRSKPSTVSSVSPRERQYVKGRLEGKSKRRAALDAGFPLTTSGNTKQKIEDKPAVQALFTALLHDAGVTDELLARRIHEGLSATAVVRKTLYSKREVLTDFSERREMAELALKLKGHLIDKHELRMVRTLEEILEEASNG